MFGVFLFLHLAGLSIWVGSIAAIAVMLVLMKKQLESKAVGALAQRTVRTFNMITHPSSFLVLISGVLMLVGMGMTHESDKPFWMHYMEKAGGTFILLFIIVISILGKKLVKKLIAGNERDAAAGINKYVYGMTVSLAFILSVVYVVSAKI
ncbi:hypothetical protein SD70_01345 [Gordoniibacillus kamchatkensis]|uniref:Copper resistance protein D domain-containing protein n=1 Tax=Gordoniibacillus kamchatkensis TaxID=1590651 RepID=A0ABR5AMG3_9BACL|nr:hypothetical protein [Paenibacillus sp. VKM B-2647]KIL42223.1 hypothetical protein SD70_01345 [Paenibacillus sp. VKM B-2647]